MEFMKTFLEIFTVVLIIAIVARSILSWFPIGSNNHPLVAVIYQITEPVLGPLRKVVPKLGMFDFTPFVAIILLFLLRGAVATQ